jgi:hypothetical protein
MHGIQSRDSRRKKDITLDLYVDTPTQANLRGTRWRRGA